MEEARITKRGGKLFVELQRENRGEESQLYDNFALREGYDRVLRCLGFTFDVSLFNESAFFIQIYFVVGLFKVSGPCVETSCVF